MTWRETRECASATAAYRLDDKPASHNTDSRSMPWTLRTTYRTLQTGSRLL